MTFRAYWYFLMRLRLAIDFFMMKMYFTTRFFLLVVVLGSGWLGCTKKEFMPPEVGEQIPYDSLSITFVDALAASPHTLFHAAWQRSRMDSLLRANGAPNVQFTLLAPDNASFAVAGWDEGTISTATVEELDTLLMRFVFRKRMEGDFTSGFVPSQLLNSLLEYPGIVETTSINLSYVVINGVYSYYYTFEGGTGAAFKAALAVSDGHVYVNGQDKGPAEPTATAEGILLPLTGWVDVPTKTAREALVEDGRFGLYVQLMDYTDAQYREIFREANGYYPDEEITTNSQYYRDSWVDYMMTYSDSYKSKYFRTPEQFREYVGFPAYLPATFRLNTFFIPTDEAFREAGFDTLSDLIAFNERRGRPQADVWTISSPSFYGIRGEFATDSLLDYHHNWGLRFVQTQANEEINFSANSRNFSLFFSKDLRQEVLGDYPLYVGSVSVYRSDGGLSHYEVLNYNQPFQFSNDGNGQVQLSVRNSGGSAATVVEGDILTLNGVIHAVDRLLLPPGFSLN